MKSTYILIKRNFVSSLRSFSRNQAIEASMPPDIAAAPDLKGQFPEADYQCAVDIGEVQCKTRKKLSQLMGQVSTGQNTRLGAFPEGFVYTIQSDDGTVRRVGPETSESVKDISSARDAIINTGEIKRGSSPAAIKDIQELLVDIGYDLGNYGTNKNGVDGDYGNASSNAVKSFQRRHKMPTSGAVDQETFNQMAYVAGIGIRQITDYESRKPERDEKAETKERDTIASTFEQKDIKNLKKVKALQDFLNTQPGIHIAADGLYGNQTKAAIIKLINSNQASKYNHLHIFAIKYILPPKQKTR